MKKPRNKGWGFIFSLLPGAGHMYLGLMKQGVSYMTIFFGILAISTLLEISIFMFLLPIVWFYNFFDYMNKVRMEPEELDAQKDKLLFLDGKLPFSLTSPKFQKYLGWGAIIAGIWIIWDQYVSQLINQLLRAVTGVNYYFGNLTRLIVAIIIIVLGVKLISGRKKQLIAQQGEEDDECGPIE